MFNEVMAVRFIRPMSTGRNKPVLLTCEDDDGEEVEVVAKFGKLCAVEGLIRESITGMLSADLDLPVPEPYLVRLTDDFLGALTQEQKVLVASQFQYGFGSKRLPNGFGPWIDTGAPLDANRDRQAVDVLALDCLLTNGDRRPENQNLLTDGVDFAIFDHELALMTTLNLLWQPPWSANALTAASPPRGHIFYSMVKSRAEYDWSALRLAIEGLSPARFNDYVNALPDEWTADNTAAQDALRFLNDLKANIVASLYQVQIGLQ